MGDYRKLDVWRRSMGLARDVHCATEAFPSTARFGLGDQIRRSAVSIPANIAEGAGRNRDTEYRRFLEIALGSANELECCLILARALGHLNPSEARRLVKVSRDVRSMLAKLIRRLSLPGSRG